MYYYTYFKPFRPSTYGQWDVSSLEKALSELDRGSITSIRRAALMYGIPRSTLHDHYSGKVELYAKPGPNPYLDLEEEEELSCFLIRCSRIGYPKTRQQVLSIVQEIMNHRHKDVAVTNGWWERFSKRHPQVSLKTSVPLAYVRAMAEDESSLEGYYNLLETTLHENGIFDRPTRIFNCDETGMPLNPKPLKVVSECGAKNPSYVCGSTKNQVSVLACSSASGYTLPPYVILARKTLNQEITFGEVPGTSYGLSPKGWMDLHLFSEWFVDKFLPNAPSARPLLLLLDGHSSHYCPEMIKTAAKEGVILFALPPHTTHLLQPLDKGAFSSLKMEWRKAVHKFISANKGREVTIYDFNTVFYEAWCKGMSASNVTAGFKCAGVYPFNRYAVKVRSERERFQKPAVLAKENGISYLPLFSPAKVSHSYDHHDSEEDSECSGCSSDQRPQSPFICTPMPDGRLNRSLSDGNLQKYVFLANKKQGTLKEFLKTPIAPKRSKGRGPTPHGRVLTSQENLALIEEQQRKKQDAARLKEARKRAREERQQMRLKKSSKSFIYNLWERSKLELHALLRLVYLTDACYLIVRSTSPPVYLSI